MLIFMNQRWFKTRTKRFIRSEAKSKLFFRTKLNRNNNWNDWFMQTPSELFDIKNFVIFITLIGSYRFDGIDGRGLLKTAKRLKFTAKMPMFRLGFTKLSNSNLKRKQERRTFRRSRAWHKEFQWRHHWQLNSKKNKL